MGNFFLPQCSDPTLADPSETTSKPLLPSSPCTLHGIVYCNWSGESVSRMLWSGLLGTNDPTQPPDPEAGTAKCGGHQKKKDEEARKGNKKRGEEKT